MKTNCKHNLCSPISQSCPSYPNLHIHLNPASLWLSGRHRPFKQGSSAQGFSKIKEKEYKKGYTSIYLHIVNICIFLTTILKLLLHMYLSFFGHYAWRPITKLCIFFNVTSFAISSTKSTRAAALIVVSKPVMTCSSIFTRFRRTNTLYKTITIMLQFIDIASLH